MTACSSRATEAARPSAARGLECSRRDLLEREAEVIAVRAESLERPGEVRLDRHADRAAGRDDAEDHTRSMCTFGAPGEEHVESELREVLKLALGRRVVDWHSRVVDEPSERVPVVT